MTSKPDFIDFLQTIPSFASLEEPILEALEIYAKKRTFNKGQFIFLEGDSCAGYHLVQGGWLKAIKISTTGREQIIQFLRPGDTFNEEAVILGATNQVTVEALEPSILWIIQPEDLLRLTTEFPALFSIISQELARRVTHLTNLIENLSLQKVEVRLARIFLEHSSGGDVMKRRRWSTQDEMAARLGTVPDVLNRALRGLAEEGLIEIQRHQIKILDRKELERKARQGE